MEGGADLNGFAWQKRGGKQQLYDINMLRMVFGNGCFSIHFKIQLVDISFLFPVGEIEFGVAVFQQLV